MFLTSCGISDRERVLRHSLRSRRNTKSFDLAPLRLGLALMFLTSCGISDREPIVTQPDPMDPEVRADMSASPDPSAPDPARDTDNDGAIDTFERRVGTDPERPDQACFEEDYRIDLTLQEPNPRADFIITVDTSGSMYQEIPRVRRGLLDYFSVLLEDSEVDIKVILIAKEGRTQDRLAMCIRPLFGGACGEPQGAMPQRSERVVHYDREVRSTNTYEVLLETMTQADHLGRVPDGWYGELRPGATPIFLNITDDRSGRTTRDFETDLRARDVLERLYAEDGARRFRWHAVVGLLGGGALLRPEEPVSERRCPTAARQGREYQSLSRLSGGLRFSVCNVVDYASVLSTAGAEVLQGGQIPCTLLLPAPGERVVLTSQLGLQLTRGEEDPELLERVFDVSSCTERGYYLGGGVQSRAVRLCPELCEQLSGETSAELLVGAGCVSQRCARTLTHLACEP